MELRDYQKDIAQKAVDLLHNHRIAYLAMECRTGKSLTALEAAARYGAKSVLVVTKLKAIPSIMADYTALNPNFNIKVVNYESVHKCAGLFDLVILDEAHSIGAFPKPSKRAKNLKTICAGLPIIYLSGTPSPESYSQLYHQFWVSSFSPFHLFPNFYKWAKVYVDVRQRMINGHTINDYSKARKDMIDSACRHLFLDWTQEEAGFESAIEEFTLVIPMSTWTRGAIYTLKRDKVLMFLGNTILADTPAKLLSKLHQLSSGTVIDEEGEHLLTDYSKAQFVKTQFAGKRIAIFYVYQSEADLLKKIFPDWTDVPEVFQNQKGISKVFLGQVRSAREGVRLDSADALIFYNLEYSYLSYEQGKNRLSSKERLNPARVYFLCSDCGIERDILEAVHCKKDFTAQYYRAKMRKHGQSFDF